MNRKRSDCLSKKQTTSGWRGLSPRGPVSAGGEAFDGGWRGLSPRGPVAEKAISC